MKIEKLTENKIRIILDIDELARKNVDFLSLTKNTEIAQKLFKKILKQAEKEVGFNADDAKLLIEAFVSADGFFIITFTKLSSKQDAPIGSPLKLRVRRKSSPNLSYSSSLTAIYEFESFEDFCNFCTYINNSKLSDLKAFSKTIVLYEYNSKYFLAFSGINKDFEYISLFYSSISEFAKLASNSSCFYSMLSEYGKVIFKGNAIKNCVKFFKCNPS